MVKHFIPIIFPRHGIYLSGDTKKPATMQATGIPKGEIKSYEGLKYTLHADGCIPVNVAKEKSPNRGRVIVTLHVTRPTHNIIINPKEKAPKGLFEYVFHFRNP